MVPVLQNTFFFQRFLTKSQCSICIRNQTLPIRLQIERNLNSKNAIINIQFYIFELKEILLEHCSTFQNTLDNILERTGMEWFGTVPGTFVHSLQRLIPSCTISIRLVRCPLLTPVSPKPTLQFKIETFFIESQHTSTPLWLLRGQVSNLYIVAQQRAQHIHYILLILYINLT